MEMEITKEMIQELRDKSGAGLLDCKRALQENNGDVAASIDALRKKGMAKADKKADRSAKEGLIKTKVSDDKKFGVIVKVNCETDFVANTDDFKKFTDEVVNYIFTKKPELKGELPADLDEIRKQAVGKLGENIQIPEWVYITGQGTLYPFLHLNKVGTIVDFAVSGNADELMKHIAMQITAMNPLSVTKDNVPKEALAKEKEIYMEEAKLTGKPAAVLEKIVEGKLTKFYEETVLLEQVFILSEESKKIKDLIADAKKEKNTALEVKSFIRVSL